MLLVDPVRDGTRQQADAGGFVAKLTSGASATSSGAHLADLASEAACQFAGTALGAATAANHEALTNHADELTSAAGHDQRADEGFVRRLRSFTS